MGKSALVLLLHPAAQWVFILGQLYCLVELNLILRLVLVAVFVVLYLLLIPNTKRGSWLWGSTKDDKSIPQPVVKDREALEQKSTPILIVSYATTTDSSVGWNHALAFRHRIFSKSVVMVAGAARSVGKMPLARIVLWIAGGLMPYTRGALVRLLKRKPSSLSPVVVISQALTESKGGTEKKFALFDKGPYSAALVCGARLIPAIVLADQKVVLGAAIDCEQVAVPTTDMVVDLAKRHSKHLEDLAKEHNVRINVTIR